MVFLSFPYRVSFIIKLKIFLLSIGLRQILFYLQATNPRGCISGGSPCMTGEILMVVQLLFFYTSQNWHMACSGFTDQSSFSFT